VSQSERSVAAYAAKRPLVGNPLSTLYQIKYSKKSSFLIDL